ncbi:LA_2478/LA_2722/LA_4182 family protein [Leptospira terpstrae]|uniref:LA_2478/LA_2722/LA_4182 family protein n=1 Tax=Leptospira terpstrae TaxID=293075 RepID=UPI003CFD9D89
MKKIFLISLFFLPLLITSQTLKDAKEFQALSKKMCAKTSECMKEKLKDLPADQRKMVESQFVNGNVCESRYKNYVVEGQKPANDKPTKKLTKQDLEDMKKCAKEMAAFSCADLEDGKVPESCEKFQEED